MAVAESGGDCRRGTGEGDGRSRPRRSRIPHAASNDSRSAAGPVCARHARRVAGGGHHRLAAGPPLLSPGGGAGVPRPPPGPRAAALDGGGRTIAVLGGGADVAYPPEHRALAGAIAASGALVSEFAPGTPPLRGHFPRRNRLLSGLGAGGGGGGG